MLQKRRSLQHRPKSLDLKTFKAVLVSVLKALHKLNLIRRSKRWSVPLYRKSSQQQQQHSGYYFQKPLSLVFMSFLFYKYDYCLNEWSPFGQVSGSFCDLATRTRLLAYMKYPGNMQLNRLRGLRINSLSSSRSKTAVINCFKALGCPKECFSGASNASFFSHSHSKFSARHEGNTTCDVTTLFWPC